MINEPSAASSSSSSNEQRTEHLNNLLRRLDDSKFLKKYYRETRDDNSTPAAPLTANEVGGAVEAFANEISVNNNQCLVDYIDINALYILLKHHETPLVQSLVNNLIRNDKETDSKPTQLNKTFINAFNAAISQEQDSLPTNEDSTPQPEQSMDEKFYEAYAEFLHSFLLSLSGFMSYSLNKYMFEDTDCDPVYQKFKKLKKEAEEFIKNDKKPVLAKLKKILLAINQFKELLTIMTNLLEKEGLTGVVKKPLELIRSLSVELKHFYHLLTHNTLKLTLNTFSKNNEILLQLLILEKKYGLHTELLSILKSNTFNNPFRLITENEFENEYADARGAIERAIDWIGSYPNTDEKSDEAANTHNATPKKTQSLAEKLHQTISNTLLKNSFEEIAKYISRTLSESEGRKKLEGYLSELNQQLEAMLKSNGNSRTPSGENYYTSPSTHSTSQNRATAASSSSASSSSNNEATYEVPVDFPTHSQVPVNSHIEFFNYLAKETFLMISDSILNFPVPTPKILERVREYHGNLLERVVKGDFVKSGFPLEPFYVFFGFVSGELADLIVRMFGAFREGAIGISNTHGGYSHTLQVWLLIKLIDNDKTIEEIIQNCWEDELTISLSRDELNTLKALHPTTHSDAENKFYGKLKALNEESLFDEFDDEVDVKFMLPDVLIMLKLLGAKKEHASGVKLQKGRIAHWFIYNLANKHKEAKEWITDIWSPLIDLAGHFYTTGITSWAEPINLHSDFLSNKKLIEKYPYLTGVLRIAFFQQLDAFHQNAMLTDPNITIEACLHLIVLARVDFFDALLSEISDPKRQAEKAFNDGRYCSLNTLKTRFGEEIKDFNIQAPMFFNENMKNMNRPSVKRSKSCGGNNIANTDRSLPRRPIGNTQSAPTLTLPTSSTAGSSSKGNTSPSNN